MKELVLSISLPDANGFCWVDSLNKATATVMYCVIGVRPERNTVAHLAFKLGHFSDTVVDMMLMSDSARRINSLLDCGSRYWLAI